MIPKKTLWNISMIMNLLALASCASSLLNGRHAGTPFSLRVRKQTYSICTASSGESESRQKWNVSAVFEEEVDSLFSNLFPHLKMVCLFPPEITLTLAVETARRTELKTLFEEKAHFVIYITIWEGKSRNILWYWCNTDGCFVFILSSPRTIKWTWQVLRSHGE